MKPAIDEFRQSTLPSRTPNEVSRGLLQFHLSIHPKLCQSLLSEHISTFFERVFFILLDCSDRDASSIEIASYSTATTFLTKMIRSSPLELQSTFISVTASTIHSSRCSILLLGSFAFIRNFIAKSSLSEIVAQVPIFHHFVDPNCESLSSIIANLGDIDDQWYSTLMAAFIGQFDQTKNAQLLTSILRARHYCVPFGISGGRSEHFSAESAEIDHSLQIVTTRSYDIELKLDKRDGRLKLAIDDRQVWIDEDEKSLSDQVIFPSYHAIARWNCPPPIS
jgi:hypothetical protein